MNFFMQAEVEALNTEASTMYKNYQNEMVFLSQEQKKARQEAIMKKEKDASDLKRKYFGPEGELFKKRESLMSPIQEEIYTAVKEIAELRGYSLVELLVGTLVGGDVLQNVLHVEECVLLCACRQRCCERDEAYKYELLHCFLCFVFGVMRLRIDRCGL